MNGFTKKSVGTLTLGEKLQKIRSERRMSLSEISRQTRIQIKYLEYLEGGKYEKLPADVYVKGFLRNYAEFLGVEDNALIRLYEKERGIRKNLEKKSIFSSGSRKVEKNFSGDVAGKKVKITYFTITPKVIGVTAVILLVFLTVFYLYREIGSFVNMPRLVIVNPTNNHITTGNSVTVEGITDRDAKIFINDQAILVSDEGKFRESIVVQSGNSVINVKAINRFGKEVFKILNIKSDFQAQEEEELTADNSGKDMSSGREMEIEIRVEPGPIWLSVETDGNLVFSGTMLSGATQIFRAENKIVIDSGKGNATFLKINGRDIGALSENSGPVRDMTFISDQL